MENEQRPITQTCSYNGKICRNGKRSDFEVDPVTQEKPHCNEWVKLSGIDPQSGTQIDTWCCAKFAVVKLALETNQSVRHTTASTDKVANQVARSRAEFLGALPAESRARLLDTFPEVAPQALPAPEQKGSDVGNQS
jgi:hypothetical protein